MDSRKPMNQPKIGGRRGRIPVNRTPFNPPNQTLNQSNMPPPRASIPQQNQNRIPHRIRHQIPQQIPQPQSYYPQPAYSQGYVYGPAPPSIHSYVIEQTAEVEFDPFFDSRNTPLPDDDDVAIPETQEQLNTQEQPNTQDDVQEVQANDVLGKKKKRADKQPWSQEEEEALAKAWVHVSTCRVVGNEQGRDKFWERILDHFASLMDGTTRSHHSLNTKWNVMNGAINLFNGLYHQANRLWLSGCNDIDVMKTALGDYSDKTGKPFPHVLAWDVVKGEAKWVEQATPVAKKSPISTQVEADTPSTHSDKRRKSLDGGNYESSSNDPDLVLPDLNEDSTPTRPRKGKKQVPESSSSRAGSVYSSVDQYAQKKEQLLVEVTEKTQKLLDLQITQTSRKTERGDMKFFMEPHDDITDPVFLAWVLKRKREIGAEYGWPCNF